MILSTIHEIAYQILEQVEHIPKTAEPTNDNTAWHSNYHGYKARRAAYKALHERDRTKADILLKVAKQHVNKWRGINEGARHDG